MTTQPTHLTSTPTITPTADPANNPAIAPTNRGSHEESDGSAVSASHSSRSPSHVAYHVREFGTGDRKKSTWTRIGSAWTHRDGQGFNLQIECLPIDGRISLRVASEKKE